MASWRKLRSSSVTSLSVTVTSRCLPGRSSRTGVHALSGSASMALMMLPPRRRRVMKPMSCSSNSASSAWVVSVESNTSSLGFWPVVVCQNSQKRMISCDCSALERSALA